MIYAKDVDVWLGKRRVISKVSLALNAGDTLAVIGPNGAGKSTLLRALARVIPIEAGQIGAHGIPADPRKWAAHVSFVRQSHAVTFEFTALEFVLMAFHASNRRWSLESPQQRDQARDALARLDVLRYEDTPVTRLSSGEFQRVLIARTLASRAKVWLLDEPNSNLDLKHQLLLLDLVRDHAADGGCVISILHDLGLVARSFNKVLGLRAGAVFFLGDTAEVMTEGNLSTLFDVSLVKIEAGENVAFVASNLDPR